MEDEAALFGALRPGQSFLQIKTQTCPVANAAVWNATGEVLIQKIKALNRQADSHLAPILPQRTKAPAKGGGIFGSRSEGQSQCGPMPEWQ